MIAGPPETPVIVERVVNVTQPGLAMFTCIAMGIPRPWITWYRVELDESQTMLTGVEEGVSITSTNGENEWIINSILEFDPTRPLFSALYICEATNPVSSSETNATLDVYGK